uniref:peptidylprolyl isomerase n=1 Tax=Astyanax mexicanus TaxID=7994 RepID=A0A8B9RHC0_ASTMX
MMLELCFLSALLFCVHGAKLPEPEVKIEVMYKPFLCHRKTKYGDILLVHYEGFLESNGTLFHSSRQHGDKNPVWFTLGIREVIKGWDKGLQNMCAGEKRKLTIPPSLAYGKEGKGKIPPESTLIFEIEVMEIRNGPRSHESFQEMDLNDDWKLSRSEVCNNDICRLCTEIETNFIVFLIHERMLSCSKLNLQNVSVSGERVSAERV